MDNKPFISLYSPSNRPQLWMWFYDNLKENSVPFEVIFVGDVAPLFELPENMRFIYTTVKLSQCAYIGAMNCNSEVIVQVSDDMQLYPGVLDNLCNRYKKENDYKCLVWPRWGTGPGDDQSGCHGNIPLGIGSIMSRKLYNEIGGYDRRYYCNTYDADLQFRARSKQFGGWYVQLDAGSQSSYMWERKEVSPGGLYQGSWYKFNGRADVKFLQSQWYAPDETLKSESTTPLEPFELNDTLLTVSQGTAHDWDEHHRNREIKRVGTMTEQELIVAGLPPSYRRRYTIGAQPNNPKSGITIIG